MLRALREFVVRLLLKDSPKGVMTTLPNKDLVDSTTQAIMRFRQGGLIGHPEDYIDEKVEQRKRNYY